MVTAAFKFQFGYIVGGGEVKWPNFGLYDLNLELEEDLKSSGIKVLPVFDLGKNNIMKVTNIAVYLRVFLKVLWP